MSADQPGIPALLRDLFFAYERFGARSRKELGLSVNEELVVLFLAQGITAPTELSEAVGMTTAGMTNLLDRLEAEGFVRRERHKTDGRRVLVTLTKRGYQLFLRLEQAYGRAGELLDGQDAAEATVARFLEQARAALLDEQDLTEAEVEAR